MDVPRPLIVPLALVLVAAAGLGLSLRESRAGAPGRALPENGARFGSLASLPAPGSLRFAPTIAASDQQVVLGAISDARPEARRLIELVSGLVKIEVGATQPGTAGTTESSSDGYTVVLDLGGVYRHFGLRGVRRLVLHELAHVIDHAIVPADVEAELDAATPPGFGCDGGRSGGCAAREERFAESFAKWATGDAGHDLYIGYRVPPPTSLAGWGAPLVDLIG